MTLRLATTLAALLALAPAARAADAGADFAQKAAKEKGAVKTASGLVYKSLVDGKGAKPAANPDAYDAREVLRRLEPTLRHPSA